MNPRAISAAKAEIARARRAIPMLEKPKNFSEAASAWFEFLLASNRVYSKLESGAKHNGRSTAWFGRMKHIRKHDELLSYLHHARNSEEHGLEHSVQIGAPQLKWLNDGADQIVAPERKGKDIILRVDQGKSRSPLAFKVTLPDKASLVPVIDTGVTFAVPKRHLGQKLPSMKIYQLGELALKYLESLVAEAETYAEAETDRA